MQGTIRIPSLIQGISQQAAIDASPASAKDQKNCINDPRKGVIARCGTEVLYSTSGDWLGSFVHEIVRDDDEEYIVLINNDGQLKVINRLEGVECTINGTLPAYFSNFSGEAYDAWCACTVEDTTFLANRQVEPQMGTTKSPDRPNWGIAHFKSAGYSTNYVLKVDIDGTVYKAEYKTVDNSTSSNADFIATNRLAEEFRDALDLILPSGFSTELLGSTIVIKGDSRPFSLATEDGTGGTQFISFTDRITNFTDLPVSNIDTYQVAVGSKTQNTSDYFLEWEGPEQTGSWKEVVKWDTKTGLDATTMPYVLKNTGKNTFDLIEAPWGARLAGDGDDTAQEPSFIGRNIVDLQFNDSRLVIITKSTFTHSRSRNAFVYFPDTAQTNLDTAPIDYTVVNGKVTIISGAVVQSKKLHMWADGVQASVGSGEDVLKEDTVESLASTSYDYDGKCPPIPLGMASVIFANNLEGWASLTEVFYRNGEAVGEIVLTEHCPELIPSDVYRVARASASKALLVTNNTPDNKVYLYQALNQGQDRVQSAWNPWVFEAPDAIIWCGAKGTRLYFLFQWPTGITLETVVMDYQGGQTGIPLRADHRVSSGVYNSEGYYTVTLPYALPEDHFSELVAYMTEDGAETARGTILPVSRVSDTEVRVIAPENTAFEVGHRVHAVREFLEFFVGDDKGEIDMDSLIIEKISVAHTDSVSYDMKIIPRGSQVLENKETFTARDIGNPEVLNDRMYAEEQGRFQIDGIGLQPDEFSAVLENSSIYPSAWRAATAYYRANRRIRR